MVRTEIGHLRESDLGGIAHEIADGSVEMSGGVVQIFSILDTNQVRYLGREQRTAVPAGDRSAIALRRNQSAKFSLGDGLQTLVRIVFQPGCAVCLIQP